MCRVAKAGLCGARYAPVADFGRGPGGKFACSMRSVDERVCADAGESGGKRWCSGVRGIDDGEPRMEGELDGRVSWPTLRLLFSGEPPSFILARSFSRSTSRIADLGRWTQNSSGILVEMVVLVMFRATVGRAAGGDRQVAPLVKRRRRRRSACIHPRVAAWHADAVDADGEC